MTKLRTFMLPPLTVISTDGRALNLQAFRHRAPAVLVFVHYVDCGDCLLALESVREAKANFPELKAVVVAETVSSQVPPWSDALVVGGEQLRRYLWDVPPTLPAIVVADRFAALRQLIQNDFALSLMGELRLLEHECPE